MKSRNLETLILISLSIFMSSIVTLAHTTSSSSIESLISEQTIADFTKGQALYNKHCIACHAASNIMVASPKFGDRDEWSTRLTANKNLKGLAKSAFKGKGAMPPKGLCLDCKTQDLETAIVYMMKGE